MNQQQVVSVEKNPEEQIKDGVEIDSGDFDYDISELDCDELKVPVRIAIVKNVHLQSLKNLESA